MTDPTTGEAMRSRWFAFPARLPTLLNRAPALAKTLLAAAAVLGALSACSGASPESDPPAAPTNRAVAAIARRVADPDRFEMLDDGTIRDASTGERRGLPDAFAEKALRSTSTLANSSAPAQTSTTSIPDLAELFPGVHPIRVLVESIKVDAPVLPVGLDDRRALIVPERADIAGWWSGGALPGDTGPTVIVGHLDSRTAPGVFAQLAKVDPGDFVIVDLSDGSTYLYGVTETEQPKKAEFPTGRVYGATMTSALRLITCGGRFDRTTRHYVDNVIVYADLIASIPAPQPVVDTTLAIPGASTTIAATVVPDGMTEATEPTTTEPITTSPTTSTSTSLPPTTLATSSTVASQTTAAAPEPAAIASTEPIPTAAPTLPDPQTTQAPQTTPPTVDVTADPAPSTVAADPTAATTSVPGPRDLTGID